MSIFSCGDALHLDGRVQEQIMHKVRRRPDGSWQRAPATSHAWDAALWRLWKKNSPGVQWAFGPQAKSFNHAQQLCLKQMRSTFEGMEAETTTVMVMDNRRFDAIYEDLKRRGTADVQNSRTKQVVILLGGAHGFDNKDDRDSTFFEDMIGLCQNLFGYEHVVRINLMQSGHINTKLTLLKVATHLATEWHTGGLHTALTGYDSSIWCHGCSKLKASSKVRVFCCCTTNNKVT